MLSTSNEDSRLVWTSSFIHSLARAQLGVGAGGVVGVASPLGTGPGWEKGGDTAKHNIALFPFLNGIYISRNSKLKLESKGHFQNKTNDQNAASPLTCAFRPLRPAAQP